MNFLFIFFLNKILFFLETIIQANHYQPVQCCFPEIRKPEYYHFP